MKAPVLYLDPSASHGGGSAELPPPAGEHWQEEGQQGKPWGLGFRV